jgi:hypothetical protein
MRKPMGYWTYEKCREEALKYDTRWEFQKKSPSAYSKSKIKNWLDDICKHMLNIKKEWSYDNLLEEVKKFNMLSDFYKSSNDAYQYAIRNGYLKDIKKELQCRKENGYWEIKENCLNEALKYKHKKDFKKKSNPCYRACCKHNWLDEVCSHMVKPKNINFIWDKKSCKKEALKYKHRTEFQKNNGSAYQSARKNGWLNDICSHMKWINRPNGYWTKEKCKKESLKYNSRSEYQKNSTSYTSAQRNGWLDEFFPK